VKDKTAALENEIRARRQAEELSAQVTKKLEVAKMDPSGDAETARQLEEYRHLLKCPTCNNRFKSHVLLKCMHPFCKQVSWKMTTHRSIDLTLSFIRSVSIPSTSRDKESVQRAVG